MWNLESWKQLKEMHYNNEEWPAFPQIGVKYFLPAALGRYY